MEEIINDIPTSKIEHRLIISLFEQAYVIMR